MCETHLHPEDVQRLNEWLDRAKKLCVNKLNEHKESYKYPYKFREEDFEFKFLGKEYDEHDYEMEKKEGR